MKIISHAISALALLLLAITRIVAQSTYESYTFTTLAGGAGYSANVAGSAVRLLSPLTVAADSAGNVYLADADNHAIRKVTPAGAVTVLAGRPGSFGSTDGTGSSARFNVPSCAALDSAGNLYVAEVGNNTIRKVTPAGVVTTLAGLAGSPGSADGTGGAARFYSPFGVAVDSVTNVYVADSDNHTIRKVTPVGTNWVVTTLAGNASIRDQFGYPVGGYVDGTNRSARFSFPTAVAVDGAGNVYVADAYNDTIRKITPVGTNWVVTTIAGLAGSPGSADGTNRNARFNEPNGLAFDSAGNLFVAEWSNNTIRKLTPLGTNWMVTTLGGMSGFYGTAGGTGSTARFSNPNGVAVDNAGNLYVADFYFNAIRKGFPPPTILNLVFAGGSSASISRDSRALGGCGSIARSGELAARLDQHFRGPSQFQRPAKRSLFESLLPHSSAVAEGRQSPAKKNFKFAVTFPPRLIRNEENREKSTSGIKYEDYQLRNFCARALGVDGHPNAGPNDL